MREALRVLYLRNDPSSFQCLLGFSNVQADISNEDELRPGVDDIAVHEENVPAADTKDNLLDTTWKNENIYEEKMIKTEESTNLSEDKNATKKENCADTALVLRGNGRMQDSLQCVKCGKKFRYGTAFRRHKVTKHQEKEEEVEKEWEALQHNFQCPCKICGKKFFSRHSMKEHRRREHPVNRIIDKQERKRIRQEKDRIWSQRRGVCDQCSKSVLLKTLKAHMRAHQKKDSPVPKQEFNCGMCGRMGKFKREDSLQRHVLMCHSGLVYKCELCDNVSTSPHAKTLHIKNRHGEKTLQCNSCDKQFTTNCYLNRHIKRRHEKAKDKNCPHCGEAFEASVAFQAHVNRHTDNRQFACEICGKSFLVQAHLKAHAKIHTLPFSCDKCDSKFGSDGILKTHTRIVHENQQINCRHGCGFSCWESSNRNRHEKSCKQNPLPNAPYTVSAGTANSFTLQVILVPSNTWEGFSLKLRKDKRSWRDSENFVCNKLNILCFRSTVRKCSWQK